MNSTVYLFGELNKGYTQYPDDYTKEIFQGFYAHANASTQITIHRIDNLMYYGYIRKLESNKYVGICIILNGLMFNDIKQLFSFFEDIIAVMLERRIILKLDETGNVVANIDELSNEIVEQISLVISNKRLIRFSKYHKDLPPVNYSVSNDDYRKFSFEDEKSVILDAITNFGNVYITKGKDIDSSVFADYAKTIKKLNQEKDDLGQKITELTKESIRLQRQKKRTTIVYLLGAFIILGCCIIFTLVGDKNNLRQENSSLEKQVNSLNSEVSNLNTSLNSKNELLESYSSKIDRLNTENRLFCDTIKNLRGVLNAPLIVTDIEIANIYSSGTFETNYGGYISSSYSMYLKPRIRYVGLSSGYITISIKWLDPDGNLRAGTSSPAGYSQSESVSIDTGSNILELSGWGNSAKGSWSSGTYRIEIWYDNICLTTKSFTIY